MMTGVDADLNPAHRRLAIAMLLRALRDARRGSGEALPWCYPSSPFTGPWWADLQRIFIWPDPVVLDCWPGGAALAD